MKIKENLFDLTQDQIDSSKMIYNGKIIKCLVAPYHSYDQLEKSITYSKTTYLFPEREMSNNNLSKLISMIVNSSSNDEFRIITSSQNVIIDMIDTSVRILTESGDIIDCPVKTFLANIHDIKYYILDNENHQTSKDQKEHSKKRINDLIKKIQICLRCPGIGEPIISNKLNQMAKDLIVFS